MLILCERLKSYECLGSSASITVSVCLLQLGKSASVECGSRLIVRSYHGEICSFQVCQIRKIEFVEK